MPKKRSKKRKFVRPKAGLKSAFKAGRISPYGSPVYHKGVIYDRLRHTVLTVDQMAEADKRFVQATLKTITNGSQAKTLPDGKNGWACLALDSRARAYVLSFRGIEVALFYQRQLTEVQLQPGDRFPEGVVQDPQEAWMRLDLIGLSAKKANLVLTTQHNRLDQELNLSIQRAATLQELNDMLESENKRLKEQCNRMLKDRKSKKGKR